MQRAQLVDVRASPEAKPIERQSSTVRSVERCIDILEALASAHSPMSLSGISRAIGSPKSTTLTIVRTLLARGLLQQDAATKQYQIGLGFARFTSIQPQAPRLIDIATPYLEALAKNTLETATLAELERGKVYNTCRFVGPQPLQLIVPIGIPRELHATAGGKIFLAWMPKEERDRFLASAPLRRFTPGTITDVAALNRHLVVCRRNGYALARGETSADLFGVAAPIFDRAAGVVAAVNLSGPLFRLAPNQARYAKEVRETARRISDALCRVIGGSARNPASSVERSR